MADCRLNWQGYHHFCNLRHVPCLWQKHDYGIYLYALMILLLLISSGYPYFFIINSIPRVATLHFRRHRHPTHVPGTFH